MKVALFEGYGRRGARVLHPRDVRGYGLIGCGEWDVLMDRLKLLLDQAETLQMTESNAYTAAKEYYDTKSGWWNTSVLYGSACSAHITEANDRIKTLTEAMMAQGAPPIVAGPEITAPTEAPDVESTIKWVAVAGITLGGAWLAATIIPRLFSKKRRLSGYQRRRRARR